LRAPLAFQIARAQAIVVVGPRDGATAVARAAQRSGLAVFHGRLEPDRQTLAALGRHKVLAFAGIADPDKFFATLLDAGVAVAARADFPDHHRYTTAEAQALMTQAEVANLMLLTTEKDLVRIGRDPQLAALAARTSALPVSLVIEEQEAFQDTVLRAMRPR
jgi:tetraacyldisaccharide 4'-kinase